MSEKHEVYSYDETDELEQLKRWREKHDDYETEVIGVYYVEGVGYCTGLAWAEKQAASFGAPSPVFVHWETMNGEDEDDVKVLLMPDEDDPHFTTVEGHDCHPDAIECCGECLELNGYDVAEESE